MKAGLYFHTLRHMRARQLLYRTVRLLGPRSVSAAGGVQWRGVTENWRAPIAKKRCFRGRGMFEMVGAEASVERGRAWQASGAGRLWNYHLHYLDDLGAEEWEEEGGREGLLRAWMEDHGAGQGWVAYPTSRRIVNWAKYGLEREGGLGEAESELLGVQAGWLARNLEYETLGNHLLANGVALLFAGSCLAGPGAARWGELGRRIVMAEMEEQVLGDGGQYERSPMYQSIVVEDLLDALNLAEAGGDRNLGEAIRAKVGPMLAWQRSLLHPDGDIALVNDANFSNRVKWEELEGYAARCGIEGGEGGGARIEESGYTRLEGGEWTVVFDAGAIGPDHIPAHSHADTLSVECSYRGWRVLVDSGTSTYEAGAERERQRGSSAHNTIVVDGENQSEVWGAFRVARRARAFGQARGGAAGEEWAEGSHDGYRRLSDPVVHRRRVEVRSGGVRIMDRLDGRGSHRLEMGYLLDPGWQAQLEGCAVELRRRGGVGPELVMKLDERMEVSVEDASYHPEFGRAERTQRVVGRWRGEMAGRFETEIRSR